jgi:hypothetical protein
MDNPVTWQHWSHKTQYEDKNKNKQKHAQKIKKMGNTDSYQKSWVNKCAREGTGLSIIDCPFGFL